LSTCRSFLLAVSCKFCGVTIDELQSFNRYAYANNNPYRFVDPDGFSAVDAMLMANAANAVLPAPTTLPTVRAAATAIGETIAEVTVTATRTVAGMATAAATTSVIIVGSTIAMTVRPMNGYVGRDCRDETLCVAAMEARKAPKDAKDPNGARAPGRPGEAEGFEDPKTGEEWVRDDVGRGGWKDASGNVWQPTGWGGLAHGGLHWDVQLSGGGYVNIRPGQRFQ